MGVKGKGAGAVDPTDLGLPPRIQGRKVHIQSTPFKFSEAEVIKGSYGPPAWSRRLKKIETWQAKKAAMLDKAWEGIRREHLSEAARIEALKEAIALIKLSEVNGLIANHNDYYPIEARLPIDSITGEPLYGGEPFQRMPKVTQGSLLQETLARVLGG